MSPYKIIIPPLFLITGIIGVVLDLMYRVSNIAGNPVLVVSAALVIVSVALFFSSEKVIFAWAKFAVWWAPLTILAVVMFPLSRGGFLPLTTDKGILSVVLWCSFTAISLILITYKSYRLRGK